MENMNASASQISNGRWKGAVTASSKLYTLTQTYGPASVGLLHGWSSFPGSLTYVT